MSRTTEENNSSLVSLAAQLQLFFSRNIFLFFFSVFFREYFKSDIILDNIFSHLPLLTVFSVLKDSILSFHGFASLNIIQGVPKRYRQISIAYDQNSV